MEKNNQFKSVPTFTDEEIFNLCEKAFANAPEADFYNPLSRKLRAFEQTFISSCNEDFEKALYTISIAIVQCVLSKVYRASADPYIWDYKRFLFSDIKEIKYDISDRTVSISFDFVQDCCTFILSNISKINTDKIGFFDKKIFVRKLDKKIRIQDKNSNGFKTVETTFVQECFKFVRRRIENVKITFFDSQRKFVYLDEVIKDEKTGIVDTIYNRLPVHCDILGDVRDTNGKEFSQYANEQVYRWMKLLVKKMKLSPTESKIFYKMFSYNCSYGAIATYLGISQNSAKGAVHRIRTKAKNLGITNSSRAEGLRELLNRWDEEDEEKSEENNRK